jgi:hypothetical protein
MPELSEAVTIRRLPGGQARAARMVKNSSDRLTVLPAGSEGEGFDAGALVEIEGAQALYLGEVVERQADSRITIAVEHFVDLGALADIEKTWKAAAD